MLQQRQIIKAVGKQSDIGDLVCTKYAIESFHSISWMLIYVIVTIYRTVSSLESYQSSSHCITMAKLRCSIEL
jgi:hypothetical protein